jgi:predicted Zn finger-like uncharacterized protein
MSQVLISCPHCEYSKEIAQAKIPVTATRVKCPHCGHSFLLADASKPVEEKQPTHKSPSPATAVAATINTAAPEIAAEVKGTADGLFADRPRQAGTRRINFAFHGTAKEYFGIWIVNTLLKIITLGIYTPWAKVRKRSYLYGCTQLEGMNFDYLANPIALLKGWLIGAVLFLLYSFGANYSPKLSMAIGLLIFVLLPWVIVRSRLFNSRYSAHRNIRFSFYPDYKGAYFAYLWLALLTPFTAGLLTPYMLFRQKQFLVENSSFGQTSFKFSATGKDYYMLFLRGLGIVLLVGISWVVMFRSVVPLIQGPGSNAGATAPLVVGLVTLFFLASYLLVAIYYYVRLTNLTWNNTRLGRHHFNSSLKVFTMMWIFFSSGVAILVSFGLLTPWATIRLTRYRLQNLSLTAHGNLEEFESANRPDVSAAGEEIGDIFGMDIGF